jgi:hypothetical protein
MSAWNRCAQAIPGMLVIAPATALALGATWMGLRAIRTRTFPPSGWSLPLPMLRRHGQWARRSGVVFTLLGVLWLARAAFFVWLSIRLVHAWERPEGPDRGTPTAACPRPSARVVTRSAT